MYVVVVFFEAKPAHVGEFRQALLINARKSVEDEPGCRQFDVAADPTDEAAFFLYEIYDDEAAFKAHLAADHFKLFDAAVAPWVASKKVLTYDLISDHGSA